MGKGKGKWLYNLQIMHIQRGRRVFERRGTIGEEEQIGYYVRVSVKGKQLPRLCLESLTGDVFWRLCLK